MAGPEPLFDRALGAARANRKRAAEPSILTRTIAEEPWRLMFAPIRRSSGTCMNLFSKIVSVIIEAPSATASRAIICAWRSVAKPG